MIMLRIFFELNGLLKDSKSDHGIFKELFDENGKELLTLLKISSTAFKISDKELALEVVTKAREISKKCEEIIDEIVQSNYTIRQAVVLTLGARYIKRIALHLSNIASSVINPLSELDYVKQENSD